MNAIRQMLNACQLLPISRPRPTLKRQTRITERRQIRELLVAPRLIRLHDNAIILRHVYRIRNHASVGGPRRIMSTSALRELALTGAITVHDPEFVVTRAPRTERDTLTVGRPARPVIALIVRCKITKLRAIGSHHEDVSLLAHRISR